MTYRLPGSLSLTPRLRPASDAWIYHFLAVYGVDCQNIVQLSYSQAGLLRASYSQLHRLIKQGIGDVATGTS